MLQDRIIQLGIFSAPDFERMKDALPGLMDYYMFSKCSNDSKLEKLKRTDSHALVKRLPLCAYAINECRHIHFDLTYLHPVDNGYGSRVPYTAIELCYVYARAWNKVTFYNNGEFIPKHEVYKKWIRTYLKMI